MSILKKYINEPRRTVSNEGLMDDIKVFFKLRNKVEGDHKYTKVKFYTPNKFEEGAEVKVVWGYEYNMYDISESNPDPLLKLSNLFYLNYIGKDIDNIYNKLKSIKGKLDSFANKFDKAADKAEDDDGDAFYKITGEYTDFIEKAVGGSIKNVCSQRDKHYKFGCFDKSKGELTFNLKDAATYTKNISQFNDAVANAKKYSAKFNEIIDIIETPTLASQNFGDGDELALFNSWEEFMTLLSIWHDINGLEVLDNWVKGYTKSIGLSEVSNEGVIDWIKVQLGIVEEKKALGIVVYAPSKPKEGDTIKIKQDKHAGHFLIFNQQHPDPILATKQFVKGGKDNGFVAKYVSFLRNEIVRLKEAKAKLQVLIDSEYKNAKTNNYVNWNDYPKTIELIKQTINDGKSKADELLLLVKNNPFIDFELYRNSGTRLDKDGKIVGVTEVSFKLASKQEYQECFNYIDKHTDVLWDAYDKVGDSNFKQLYSIADLTPTDDKKSEGEDYFAEIWLNENPIFEIVTQFSDAMSMAWHFNNSYTLREYKKSINYDNISTESVIDVSLEEETKPEEPTSDEANTEEETQDETTDNESPDESQTDDQADSTETPPEEDTGSNGEDDTESDQTTSEETSEDEERREERRETRREEVRLDNPEDEKVKISSYLEPLLGDKISELTLFSAAEINRPLYHVSMNPSIERFTPQVSKRTLGKEDRSVPRISTSTSLIGCLNGYQSMVSDMEGRAAKNFNGLFKVYELPYQYAVKPSRKLLSDVENSDEYWLVSWKKETYATYPIQIADFTIPKIEKVFGADGKDETFHVYIKVTNGTLYIDHQRKLEKGYYHMTMKGYTFKYPLKNNNLITIENITENEYNKVTALSMMIKKR